MEDHRFPLSIGGPESLVLPPLVIADHCIGRIQNMTGGTVILLQLNDFCPRKCTFKIQDIADVGTTELINRLVIIAYHAEVFIFSGQKLNQTKLRRVGILVLIHHDIAETLLIIFQHIRIRLEQIHGFKNKIIEIQCIIFL